MFGTMDIGIISPVFRKLKSIFKNIFIGLKHLELRKRKIVDVIPHQQNSTFHVQSFGRSHKQSSFYTQTRYVKGLFLVQRRSGENFR